jgi:ABC-type sugar transport system ATPase subunit
MTEKSLNKKSNRDDNNALRLKNISKIYPGTIALKNINMDIEKGKIHGIIGKNGAGKSTLIGIIAGIIAPTRGEIFIGDKKYNALSRIEAKNKKISIVTQEPEIIPDCTIAENLFLPRRFFYKRTTNFINT